MTILSGTIHWSTQINTDLVPRKMIFLAKRKQWKTHIFPKNIKQKKKHETENAGCFIINRTKDNITNKTHTIWGLPFIMYSFFNYSMNMYKTCTTKRITWCIYIYRKYHVSFKIANAHIYKIYIYMCVSKTIPCSLPCSCHLHIVGEITLDWLLTNPRGEDHFPIQNGWLSHGACPCGLKWSVVVNALETQNWIHISIFQRDLNASNVALQLKPI